MVLSNLDFNCQRGSDKSFIEFQCNLIGIQPNDIDSKTAVLVEYITYLLCFESYSMLDLLILKFFILGNLLSNFLLLIIGWNLINIFNSGYLQAKLKAKFVKKYTSCSSPDGMNNIFLFMLIFLFLGLFNFGEPNVLIEISFDIFLLKKAVERFPEDKIKSGFHSFFNNLVKQCWYLKIVVC